MKDWNLVADVGGTNARFGLQSCASGMLEVIESYSVSDYKTFTLVVERFLQDVEVAGGWQEKPQQVCLAVACPVDGENFAFTNNHWVFSRSEVSRLLGDVPVNVINDFTAVGHAVSKLTHQDWYQIGRGSPVSGKPIAVLGPGTGIGVCTLVPVGAGYKVVDGAGGHIDFAPVDDEEIEVLRLLTCRFGRVSVERLLSGEGIVNIYRSLATLSGLASVEKSPAEISRTAVAGTDSLSARSLNMFCRILGSTAGNLALISGAKGGVYIAGGIVPRFVEFLEKSEFRQRFEAKGRFQDYIADIPTRVVLKSHLGLIGAGLCTEGSPDSDLHKDGIA